MERSLDSGDGSGVAVGSGRLGRLATRFDVQPAAVNLMLLRGWQVVSGALTVVLITLCFSPELQGFYVTFGSLLAVQSLFDLGLSTIVTNLVSHEWAHVAQEHHLDTSPPLTTRLIELGRRLFRWYFAFAIAFCVLVGIGGVFFFLRMPEHFLSWRAPWCCSVLATSLIFVATPFLGVLEACGRVESLTRMRLLQAVLCSLGMWISLLSGLGLWAIVVTSSLRVLCELFFVLKIHRHFFAPFLLAPESTFIDWQQEIWPLQWRIAVQAIASYCATGLFTPILLASHGPELAGKLGMTWTVVSALQQAALAWIQPRVPQLALLAARRQFQELDQLYQKFAKRSLVSIVLAGALFWLGVTFGRSLNINLLARFADSWTIFWLILVFTFHLIFACQGHYVRAHKREPFLVLSIVTDSLVAAVTWSVAPRYGPTGAVCGMFLIAAFITYPWQSWIIKECQLDRKKQNET